VTIPFTDKPITLLFGENGTGKSSIIDGLEFVLKGTAGSIEDISGASAGSHIPTLSKKAKEVFAEAKLTEGTVMGATLAGNRITRIVSNPSASPNAAILRRSRILNLVTAKPGERYEALVSFIDVSGVEAAEESLAKAINDQRKTLESITTRVRLAVDELQRHFTEQASEDEKHLAYENWAAKYASQDIADLKRAVESLAEVNKNYASANEALTEANSQQTLLDNKREEKNEAQTAFNEALKKAPGAVDLLIDLLNAGNAYVEAVDTIDKCPICSNATNKSTLAAEIEAKLASLPGIQVAKTKRDTANNQFQQAANRTWDFYIRILRSARPLLHSIEKLTEKRRHGIDPANASFIHLKDLPSP
jgi:DNA repair exonuclease SbcCD ATPase subunit